MKVRELINLLKKMPQDAPVCFYADGDAAYIGGAEMRQMGGHCRLDDASGGGWIEIAKIKKHRAVVLVAHSWDELSEPSIVKWVKVEPQDLDSPDFYKRMREACQAPQP